MPLTHYWSAIKKLPPAVIVALVVLGSVVVRCLASIAVPMEIVSDGGSYWRMAENIVDGNGIRDAMGNYAFYSAGYPILIAPFFMLLGKTTYAILSLNIILAAISVAIIYQIGKSWFDSTTGIIAAILWGLYLPSILFTTVIAKENLMTPLILGLIWVSSVWVRSSQKTVLTITAGVLTGILAIVGMTGVVFAAVFALIVLKSGAGIKQILISGIIFSTVMVLTLSPWLYRNAEALGAPVITTNSGFNLYLGNNPAATGYFVSISDTPFASEWHHYRAVGGELLAGNKAKEAAVQYISQHPTDSLMLAFKKAALFWIPPIDLEKGSETSTVEKVIRFFWLVQYLVLLGLTIYAVASWRSLWPLLLGIVLFTAAHMPYYVMSRYQLPVMALLCLTSAWAITHLLLKIKANRITSAVEQQS